VAIAGLAAAAEDGVHDHLTEFSRPVSGAYYFAPSLSALNDLAGPEDE
jgi:putative iron-dependent peroxidase